MPDENPKIVGRLGKTYWHHRTVIAENIVAQLMKLIGDNITGARPDLYDLSVGWDEALIELEDMHEPEILL